MRRLAPITARPPAFLGPSGTCVGPKTSFQVAHGSFPGCWALLGAPAGPSASPLYLTCSVPPSLRETLLLFFSFPFSNSQLLIVDLAIASLV